MDRRSFLAQVWARVFTARLLADAKAAAPAGPPSSKIREVRAIRLKERLSTAGSCAVYTEEGLTGTGECVDSIGTETIINNNFNV